MRKFILKVLIVLVFVVVAIAVFKIAPDFEVGDIYGKDEIRIVMDDKEITKKIPDPVKIIDGKIMLSRDTVDIWFDKYLYYDEKYSTIISTTDTSVAKLKIGEKKIDINGAKKDIEVPAQVIDDIIYIPIEELADMYEISVLYNEKVIMSDNYAENKAIVLAEDLSFHKLKKDFCRIIIKAQKSEKIEVYGDATEKWVLARDSKGNIGYVDTTKISVDMEKTPASFRLPKIDRVYPKINLVWDYAEYAVPDRNAQRKIDAIDIIAPTCFYVKNTNCDIKNTLTNSYVSWANDVGYKVWVTVKNDILSKDELSEIVTDMELREKLINNLLSTIKNYNVNGINIDFENMYKEDSNEFSQFVRELSSTFRRNGYAVSIDVTVPDGSDTWSLCYDRDALAYAVDYMVLMAYDKVGSSEKKEDSSAPLYWVKSNIEKMVDREEVPAKKLILGIPLYSKTCVTENGEITSATTWDMEDALSKYSNESEWNEDFGQYIIKYDIGNSTRTIWLENKDSIKKKIELANEYELAGTAYWRLGFETEDVWSILKETFNK